MARKPPTDTKRTPSNQPSRVAAEATRRFGVAPRADAIAFGERFGSGWRAGVDHASLCDWVRAHRATAGTRARRAEPEPLEDVAELYGPAQWHDATTRSFWAEPLWRHAYPVGRAMNGDELVQVGAGRSAGEILRIDHETFDAALARWTGSTDALVDALLEEPAEIVAGSMPELCARVCAAQQAVPRIAGPQAFPALPCAMQSLAVDGDRILLGPSYEGGPVTFVRGGQITTLPITRQRVWRVALRGSRVLLLHADGVELSDDDGTSFRTLEVGRASDAMLAPDGTIWVARGGEVGFSVDGASFAWLAAPPGWQPSGLVATSHGVAAVHHDRFFLISKDEVRVTRPRRSLSNRAVTETPAGTLLDLVEAVGVLRSVDGGGTWRKAKGGPPGGQHLVTSSDGSVTAIDGKAVYRSTDDGASFERARRLRNEPDAVAAYGAGVVALSVRELAWIGPEPPKIRRRK